MCSKIEQLTDQRWIIGDILGLQCVDHPQQLLGNMGHGNLMGLSLSPLLDVIFSENGFVRNKWKAAVEKGASEMRRAMLNHVAGGFKLARLSRKSYRSYWPSLCYFHFALVDKIITQ